MPNDAPKAIRVDGHVYVRANDDSWRWNTVLTAANYLADAVRKNPNLRMSPLLAQVTLEALADAVNPKRDDRTFDQDLERIVKIATQILDESRNANQT